MLLAWKTAITPSTSLSFLEPGKKWSNETGKVFDIEEPDA